VFVDIAPDTYNLDPKKLEAVITSQTRAIIPVHIYGQPADMSRIMEVARRHKLYVIEDAAQAHGATWQGRQAGTLADAACFSFYPGKNLGAYGDAGAVTTNNPEIADRVRLLRNHGRHGKYLHEIKGFGQRMDALQAAILGAKLPYLAGWIESRRRLAARYNELLADTELVLPHVADGANPAWHLYVVRTPRRDEMLAYLRERGIGAGVHYPIPLHLQPAYADLGYEKGAFPVSEAVAETCLSLPLYPEMTEAQQEYIVRAVIDFLEG
jgi:dTDP-4-amino-4,6-dideoxygalactose transaminase